MSVDPEQDWIGTGSNRAPRYISPHRVEWARVLGCGTNFSSRDEQVSIRRCFFFYASRFVDVKLFTVEKCQG